MTIDMKKKIRAVAPYSYKDFCNFKSYPYFAWRDMGYAIAESHYPCRALHGLAYKCELPQWFKSEKEARLRFVSGYSIRFDSFPDYAMYEIVPVIWDCWPGNVEAVKEFFVKHDVRTAIFTSSQTADVFREAFPKMNILTITEGVNTELYSKGKELKDRGIDVLEVGRAWVNFFKTPLPKEVTHVKTGNTARAFNTDEEFREALADAKVTINVPRCDVDEKASGIETLTQRYWECMLSRVVMVGRAPKELIDLIGYNPVVEFEGLNDVEEISEIDASATVMKVLGNIENYQTLVDRNYETAREMAPWTIRVKRIADFLSVNEYTVS